ncbi:MAG TPA: hypothetical protein VE083_11930 [Terriglobales bacterium]|nr:hypothetical protein [Terriglobales bacterium]
MTRWSGGGLAIEAPSLPDLARAIDYAKKCGRLPGGKFVDRVLKEGRCKGFIRGPLGGRADKEFDEIADQFAWVVGIVAKEAGESRAEVAEVLIAKLRKASV